MSFDLTIHIGEMLIICGAAWAVLKGGVAMRDAVIALNGGVKALQTGQHDHEERLRDLEWRRRRSTDHDDEQHSQRGRG